MTELPHWLNRSMADQITQLTHLLHTDLRSDELTIGVDASYRLFVFTEDDTLMDDVRVLTTQTRYPGESDVHFAARLIEEAREA